METTPRTTISCPTQQSPGCCGATILEALGDSKRAGFYPDMDEHLKARWDGFSAPFRVLCAWLMTTFGSHWREFPDFYGDDHWPVEPQIPYFYVTARVDEGQYGKAFRFGYETDEADPAARSAHDREIGAVLGRWLEAENIQHVNPEYYRSHDKGMGDFISSQHRDSQIFITFSPIASLSLSSTMEKEPIPSSITKDSALRFFEFSRLRWHQMLWTNRQLDTIIDDVMSSDRTTARMVPLLDRISRTRHKAIRVLNDPIQHVWNTMVASDLPDLLELKYLDRLEETTITKLRMLDKLVEDRLQVDRLTDFAAFYGKNLSTVKE